MRLFKILIIIGMLCMIEACASKGGSDAIPQTIETQIPEALPKITETPDLVRLPKITQTQDPEVKPHSNAGAKNVGKQQSAPSNANTTHPVTPTTPPPPPPPPKVVDAKPTAKDLPKLKKTPIIVEHDKKPSQSATTSAKPPSNVSSNPFQVFKIAAPVKPPAPVSSPKPSTVSVKPSSSSAKPANSVISNPFQIFK